VIREPAVFVDRDGTLIRDVGYLCHCDQIEILPRVPEALRLLYECGLKVVVVSNQSAVARGYLSEDDLRQIHEELKRQLALNKAFLDGIYYCPHHPTEGIGSYRVSCACRKPDIGLVKLAGAALNLDLGRSYVVGDQWSDMELAARIGVKGMLIQDEAGNGRQTISDREKERTDFLVVSDLFEAAQWISEDLRTRG
jgi:D-glycero-D-manno-heptose 1,7-bisphosphate phosphatase